MSPRASPFLHPISPPETTTPHPSPFSLDGPTQINFGQDTEMFLLAPFLVQHRHHTSVLKGFALKKQTGKKTKFCKRMAQKLQIPSLNTDGFGIYENHAITEVGRGGWG